MGLKVKSSFRGFSNTMKNFKVIREAIKKSRPYLTNGTFYYDLSGKAIGYTASATSNNFINKMKRETGKEERKIKTLVHRYLNLFHSIRITNKNGNFHGEVIMVTRDQNIKIFDFRREKVITFIRCEDDFELLRANYLYFKEYYNIPDYSFQDPNIIIEDLIEFKKNDEWNSTETYQALSDLSESICLQMSNLDMKHASYKTTKDLLDTLRAKLNQKEIIQIIERHIPQEAENDRWLMIKSHGDFNFNNMLLSDDKFYYIDWADSNLTIFFYDLINCVLVDALYTNNHYYLNSYIHGDYDQQLKKLFGLQNIKFNPAYRIYYIVVYIAERLLKFELSKPFEEMEAMLKRYEALLKHISDFL